MHRHHFRLVCEWHLSSAEQHTSKRMPHNIVTTAIKWMTWMIGDKPWRRTLFLFTISSSLFWLLFFDVRDLQQCNVLAFPMKPSLVFLCEISEYDDANLIISLWNIIHINYVVQQAVSHTGFCQPCDARNELKMN